MPLEKLSGIVLRYADYRDNDRILTVFTREKGKLSIASRGCKRQNSPLQSASQLFAYSEMVAYSGRGKYSLNSADLCEAFYPLREDIVKFECASFMLALSDFITGEEEPSEALFTLLYHCLSYTAYSDMDPMDVSLCLAVRALTVSGYSPKLTSCVRCGAKLNDRRRVRFAPQLGGSVCNDCSGEHMEVSALTLEAMRRMSLLEDKQLRNVRLPSEVRRELTAVVKAYYLCIYDGVERCFDILARAK
ncbi:MAG: DNA repair protein RecO [Clostridia bacterium]|nr:DNA repair protein RecO [Clostridia bacterium]